MQTPLNMQNIAYILAKLVFVCRPPKPLLIAFIALPGIYANKFCINAVGRTTNRNKKIFGGMRANTTFAWIFAQFSHISRAICKEKET